MTSASERLGRSIHCARCDHLHPHWNRCVPPALAVAPGDHVMLVSPDASNGLLGRESTAADIALIDFRKLDPLCGPIFVDGAKPGDMLALEIVDLELDGWGWTGLLPDFGLLSDEFPQPFFRGFDLKDGFVDLCGESFPLKPMLGVLGVAPGQDGDFASITPTIAGGNIDVRYLSRGARLYLPVFNEGALISGGDGHALQGEGEISGTAIEAAMSAVIKIELVKERQLRAPVVDISVTPYAAETEYRDFLGVGPDLFEAARDATRFAVEALARSLKVEPFEAYALLGMIGELRIHEIVDKPNWVVGCMIPRRMFGRGRF